MGEIIGEVVMPIEFVAPNKPTASLPAAPKLGSVFYDTTTNKLKVWTGAAYEEVTSA
jgi:hypothetical protein